MPATIPRPRETTDPVPGGPYSNAFREDASDFAAPSRVAEAPALDNYQTETAETETADTETADTKIAAITPSFTEALAGSEASRVEWREVAPLVDRFTNEVPEAEHKRRPGLRKRHRTFVMSGVFWAGLLFGLELIGLVYLYSLDLTAVRAADALDRDIQKTSLAKTLAENQLATSSSPTKLNVWAGQLGYHRATLEEMDDVTSNTAPKPIAPLPADAAQ